MQMPKYKYTRSQLNTNNTLVQMFKSKSVITWHTVAYEALSDHSFVKESLLKHINIYKWKGYMYDINIHRWQGTMPYQCPQMMTKKSY